MIEWFLILVLSTGQGSEVTIAVHQPDEATCRENLNEYVYAEETYQGPGDTTHNRYVIHKDCESAMRVDT